MFLYYTCHFVGHWQWIRLLDLLNCIMHEINTTKIFFTALLEFENEFALNLLQRYNHWGLLYEIHFDLTVNDSKSITSWDSWDSGCDLTTSSGSCCSEDNPCDIDEGDCDSEFECMPGLTCGTNNCPAGFPSDHDCCLESTTRYVDVFRFTNAKPGMSGCDADTYGDYGNSLPNGVDSGSCCTSDNPCDVDEGDCDNDDECMHGLTCGSNNCPNEFPSNHDCCTGTKNDFELLVQLDVNAIEGMTYFPTSNKGDYPEVVVNAARISVVTGGFSYSLDLDVLPTESNNFVIKQYLEPSGYYYEIVIDGVSEALVENTTPQLSSVGLYANSLFTTDASIMLGEVSSFSAGIVEFFSNSYIRW